MGIFWGVLAASSQGGGAFLVPHTPEALWCAEGRCRRGAVCGWGVPALGTEPPGTLGPLRPRHHTGVGGTPPCHLPSAEGSLRPPAPPEWPGGHRGGGIPSTGGSRLSSLPHRALVNAELLCFLFFSFFFVSVFLILIIIIASNIYPAYLKCSIKTECPSEPGCCLCLWGCAERGGEPGDKDVVWPCPLGAGRMNQPCHSAPKSVCLNWGSFGEIPISVWG